MTKASCFVLASWFSHLSVSTHVDPYHSNDQTLCKIVTPSPRCWEEGVRDEHKGLQCQTGDIEPTRNGPKSLKVYGWGLASHAILFSPIDMTDGLNRPNTMLDKADNITLSLGLDSVENKVGHRCLTLVSVCSDGRTFHKTYNHPR